METSRGQRGRGPSVALGPPVRSGDRVRQETEGTGRSHNGGRAFCAVVATPSVKGSKRAATVSRRGRPAPARVDGPRASLSEVTPATGADGYFRVR